MCSYYLDSALFQIVFSYFEKCQAFISVDIELFVSNFEFVAQFIFSKARLFGYFY